MTIGASGAVVGGWRYRNSVDDDTGYDGANDKEYSKGDTSIQHRDVAGEWHDLDVEPKPTGDPEIDTTALLSALDTAADRSDLLVGPLDSLLTVAIPILF